MKHKHAELIHAWADGAKIEARYQKASGWTEWAEETGGFYWYQGGAEYRIKPEPKPDVELYAIVDNCNNHFASMSHANKIWTSLCNLKLTFDGETKTLKSAEVLE